jgi:hypothetical protein
MVKDLGGGRLGVAYSGDGEELLHCCADERSPRVVNPNRLTHYLSPAWWSLDDEGTTWTERCPYFPQRFGSGDDLKTVWRLHDSV